MIIKQYITVVSGKSGLFKVVSPTRNGVILESLDENKKKFVAGPNARISILKEISIYTNDAEGSILLEDVLKNIKEKHSDKLELDSKSPENELWDFLGGVVPGYDDSKVYLSDVKKLVTWYKIICVQCPEIINGEEIKEEAKKPKAKTKIESKPAEKKEGTSKK